MTRAEYPLRLELRVDDELRAMVEAGAQRTRANSTSDYLRDLIRQDAKRSRNDRKEG